MKKRSILVTLLAVVLACVISVGGTLAYLAATDIKVVNTFEFAKNMKVTLTEDVPDSTKLGEAKVTGDEKGYTYTNVVPGQTLPKAPHIKTTTDVKAYVFVKISGATAQVHPKEIDSNWTAVEYGNATTNFNGIYVREVSGSETEQDLGNIFKEVVVDNVDLLGKDAQTHAAYTLKNIQIDVYEIQQEGFANATAAYEKTPDAFKDFDPADITPVTPTT